MKEQFVPYEIALELKKLDFNEECLNIYFKTSKKLSKFDGKIHKNIYSENIKCSGITAPLYQQAFKWFREKYNFDLNWKPMSMVGITCYYDIEIHHPKYVWDIPPKVTGKTYEEAELECLKKLIEIVKNK